MPALEWSIDEQKPLYLRSGDLIGLPSHSDFARVAAAITQDTVTRYTQLALDSLGAQKLEVSVRSVSAYPYDCAGMVFANRRALVTVDNIRTILRLDGYRRVQEEELAAGDIVLYENQDGPTHVGLVTLAKTAGVKDIRVLSKWGYAGEIEHHLHVVPQLMGVASEFWTERVPYEAD